MKKKEKYYQRIKKRESRELRGGRPKAEIKRLSLRKKTRDRGNRRT